MRYWWVNQNQTYVHEVGGGYLWSPKVNANGRRNRFYDSMTEAVPGDVVFSFCDTEAGSRGDSYDNALAETINGLYKAELIHRWGP